MNMDIRWIQRFENFQKALCQLEEAIALYNTRNLTEIEKQGLIKSFELTFELAWNLIRDYLLYQGISENRGSRDTIKLAIKYEILENFDIWIEILISRNLSVHTYNKNIANSIIINIVSKYYNEFKKLKEKFEYLKENEFK